MPGKATVDGTIKAFASEQTSFNVGRIGIWPDKFANSQVSFDAMAAVFEKTGEAVFVTHSQGGGIGWLTVIKSNNVKGVVSYEPGSGFLYY